MRVKCLAQDYNTMSPARTRTPTTRSGVERTNHEATAPQLMKANFYMVSIDGLNTRIYYTVPVAVEHKICTVFLGK